MDSNTLFPNIAFPIKIRGFMYSLYGQEVPNNIH